MTMPTQLSLSGFIVNDPDLRFTASGKEHVRVRVGVEQWRHELTAHSPNSVPRITT